MSGLLITRNMEVLVGEIRLGITGYKNSSSLDYLSHTHTKTHNNTLYIFYELVSRLFFRMHEISIFDIYLKYVIQLRNC